jgi:hypothetical protein
MGDPSTYRTYQVTGQRQFELVNRELIAPNARHVPFRVQLCGVCHSDLLGVESLRRIHRRWPRLATRTVQRRIRVRAKQITLGVVAEPDSAKHHGGAPHE